MSTFVHWEEGLFLQPHHFQMMQRQVALQALAERELAWPHPYGVIESRLSMDALRNRQVQFERLRVLMPSGILVDVPANAELPVLSIEEHLKASSNPVTVRLAVPLWHRDRPNVVESNGELSAVAESGGGGGAPRLKRLFRTSSVEAADENTGDNVRPLRVRRINAMLLTDADETSDLETLPLLRVVPGTGREGAPRLDEGFIPPCLVIAGWPGLWQLARDISNTIEGARGQTMRVVKKDGLNMETLRGRQFGMILRLRTLNRFAAVIPRLIGQARTLPPFDLYVRLCELVGELAALHPDRDAVVTTDYDHTNPAPLFHDIKKRITELCPPGAEESVLEVAFTREQQRFAAALSEQHITAPNEYFLAVKTREDPRGVQTLIEDGVRTKLMSKSKSGAKIYGVPLERELNPPVQLPQETGLHYFRLMVDANPKRWEEIKSERQLVLEGSGVMAHDDFKFTLYMTVPGAGSGGGERGEDRP